MITNLIIKCCRAIFPSQPYSTLVVPDFPFLRSTRAIKRSAGRAA